MLSYGQEEMKSFALGLLFGWWWKLSLSKAGMESRFNGYHLPYLPSSVHLKHCRQPSSGPSSNNPFCMQLKTSSSSFLSLCFSTVSVEKVELKGLAHKKNERNVEYSFEVSSADCFWDFFFPLKEGRITLKKELKQFSNIVRSQKLVLKDRCLVFFFFNQ